jgi:threonine aldolase
MRFLAAQWVGMLQDKAWLRHAAHANAMAKRLHAEIRTIPGAQVTFPVEANSVFVNLQPELLAGLRGRGWDVYTFIGSGGARFMCSWDTTESDIAMMLDHLRVLVRKEVGPDESLDRRGRKSRVRARPLADLARARR